MSDEAHEATPDHELERQIMSYNEAKNEREWWAMHEIERLREALRRLVAWGAACPTEREDRLSHAAEGAKAFHAARAALGEDVHD